MDWSAEGILKIWNTDIIEIIKDYAEVKDKYAGDIRVVGPSIAHKWKFLNHFETVRNFSKYNELLRIKLRWDLKTWKSKRNELGK